MVHIPQGKPWAGASPKAPSSEGAIKQYNGEANSPQRTRTKKPGYRTSPTGNGYSESEIAEAKKVADALKADRHSGYFS